MSAPQVPQGASRVMQPPCLPRTTATYNLPTAHPHPRPPTAQHPSYHGTPPPSLHGSPACHPSLMWRQHPGASGIGISAGMASPPISVLAAALQRDSPVSPATFLPVGLAGLAHAPHRHAPAVALCLPGLSPDPAAFAAPATATGTPPTVAFAAASPAVGDSPLGALIVRTPSPPYFVPTTGWPFALPVLPPDVLSRTPSPPEGSVAEAFPPGWPLLPDASRSASPFLPGAPAVIVGHHLPQPPQPPQGQGQPQLVALPEGSPPLAPVPAGAPVCHAPPYMLWAPPPWELQPQLQYAQHPHPQKHLPPPPHPPTSRAEAEGPWHSSRHATHNRMRGRRHPHASDGDGALAPFGAPAHRGALHPGSDGVGAGVQVPSPCRARRYTGPRNAFMLFSQLRRQEVCEDMRSHRGRRAHQPMDNRKVSKRLGQLWKRMSTEQRAPYQLAYQHAKQRARVELQLDAEPTGAQRSASLALARETETALALAALSATDSSSGSQDGGSTTNGDSQSPPTSTT